MPPFLLRTRRLTLAAGITLLLTACGEDAQSGTPGGATGTDAEPIPSGSVDTGTDAGGSEATLSDAEVMFLRGMIPHHTQATEMAGLVAERAEHDELRGFADGIIAAQGEEVTTMRALLEAAGEAADGMGGMDMGGMDMPGMVSDEDMATLEGLTGQAFDLAFLDAMTAHHRGALEAARAVLDADPGPDVAALAAQIMAEQEAEIARMDGWRREWAA